MEVGWVIVHAAVSSQPRAGNLCPTRSCAAMGHSCGPARIIWDLTEAAAWAHHSASVLSYVLQSTETSLQLLLNTPSSANTEQWHPRSGLERSVSSVPAVLFRVFEMSRGWYSWVHMLLFQLLVALYQSQSDFCSFFIAFLEPDQ